LHENKPKKEETKEKKQEPAFKSYKTINVYNKVEEKVKAPTLDFNPYANIVPVTAEEQEISRQ